MINFATHSGKKEEVIDCSQERSIECMSEYPSHATACGKLWWRLTPPAGWKSFVQPSEVSKHALLSQHCENDSLVHTVLQSPWHIPQVCISHMLHVQQNMLFSISGLPKRALPGKKSSYVGNNFSSTPTNAVHWRLALLPNLQHYIVTPPLVEFKRDLKAAGKIPAEQIFYLRKGRTWYAVLLFSTDFYS